MRTLSIPLAVMLFVSCNNAKKENEVTDKRIVLHSDTLNVVKLTDTLLIPESTCRGCAYENSTDFEINDSLGIIRLNGIITTDNNPGNMDGGSISKLLVLVPLKTGTTTFKLYKFWSRERTNKDSANARSYTVEVKN
ncbi:MAG TPA: hypothetical protein VGO58_09555 [Chitinophagaceae bacterium]|nr:hypothetical protein [Chitinophagaceae bacterium]